MATEAERFEYRFRVGWGDLDSNAHMANTAFLDRAADTRMLYLAKHGFTVEDFGAEKLGPVVVRDEIVYRKELRLLEEFSVDYQVAGLSSDGVSFRIRNTFRNMAEELSATLTSEGVWFDLEKRKPRVPPTRLENLMRVLRRTEDFVEIPNRQVK